MTPVVRKRRAPVQPSLFESREAPTKPSSFDASMRRADEELEKMIAADDFHGARPLHIVALYLRLHLRVYGIAAVDCGPSDRAAAAGRVTKMIADDFDGSGERAVEFLRWTWNREAGREKWRRENGRSGQRISWRLQFSSALLVDYKLDLARKEKSG